MSSSLPAGQRATVSFKVEAGNFGGVLDNKLGTWHIYLDNDYVAKVSAGGKAEFSKGDVVIGTHWVRADYTLSSIPGTKIDTIVKDVCIYSDDVIRISLCIGTKSSGEYWKLDVDSELERGRVVDIELDEELFLKVVRKSQPIMLPPGSEKTVEDTIKITHAVSIMDGHELESSIQAMWSVVAVGVKGKIEQAINKTYQLEEAQTRSVKLVGDGKSRTRVVWCELYRTGVATVIVKGSTQKVPFKFLEDFDLLAEDAK